MLSLNKLVLFIDDSILQITDVDNNINLYYNIESREIFDSHQEEANKTRNRIESRKVEIFNDDKCVTQIVRSGNDMKNWIVAGYHAMNG